MAQTLSLDQLIQRAVKIDGAGKIGINAIAQSGSLTAVDLSKKTKEQILRALFSDNGDGTFGLNVFGSGGGSITIDSTPTNGSANAVSSDGVFDALATKQATLVSATNIKTVNGSSLLGSGDLVVSGSSLTEYGVAAVGSAGILVRFYATAGITVTKTNSSTLTFTIPASGYIQSFDIYYPSAENPASTTTLIFNYVSNTTTNQGFSTAKVAYIYAMTGTRIVGARNNATDILIDAAAASGNITHVLTNPAGIQTGDIKLFGTFA